MTDQDVLKVQRDGWVTVLTMNRPARLNALDASLTLALHDALDAVAGSDARVLILTGEGRGFTSGADVANLLARAEGKPDGAELNLSAWIGGRSIIDLAPRLRALPQPVIAAVNGYAVGAGMALALAADIRIASDQARFASLFIKRSLTPDAGVSQMLPRLVGPGTAAEMALTGSMYNAEWALQHGLVNRVVPHGRLLEEARVLADLIAENPPIAARVTKQLLYRGLHYDLQQGIDNESYYNTWLRKTEDSMEAIQAFVEKRTPVFHGR